MVVPPATDLIGREDELLHLRTLGERLTRGRGGAVLIEGEPGIGKSTLLAHGLRHLGATGAEVCWAVADELGQRSPLRVMFDCLGVHVGSADPQRAEITALLRGGPVHGAQAPGLPDGLSVATERLLTLVDRLCVRAPLVVVVDDLQWADEWSLVVWHRLARTVTQLPLLLAGAYRPVPRRRELTALRRSVREQGGLVLRPGPLSQQHVDLVVDRLLGNPPGPALRQMAAQSGGNPMYLRELVAALKREDAIVTDGGVAELRSRREPVSLAGAIASRLTFLSPETTRMLRVASLLGVEFSVLDVATVLAESPIATAPAVQEAQAAEVVVETGLRLAFRHPLLRHALYTAIPRTVRSALHRHAAEALAAAGADIEDVTTQLLAAGTVDDWVLDWLVASSETLTARAPELAATLLRRAVDQVQRDDPRWEVLAARLATTLFRTGDNRQAQARASEVLAVTTDPKVAAAMHWVSAYLALRMGRGHEVQATLRAATTSPDLPEGPRARLLAMAAALTARATRDLDAARRLGDQAVLLGRAAGDPTAVALGLHTRSVVDLVRRDPVTSLDHVTAALAALGDDDSDPEGADVRLLLLANQVYALLMLDRIGDAEQAVAVARTAAEHSGVSRSAGTVHMMAAALDYLTGRWDDAAAELDSTPDLGDTTYRALSAHGISALLAVRRDQRAAARAHLNALRNQSLTGPNDRNFADYLIVARALGAARDGDPEAVRVFATILEPRFDVMLRRFDWLPLLVRMALQAGDAAIAAVAAETARREAEATGGAPAVRAAAQRCAALLSGDPQPLREVAEHYRRVGRVTGLAEVLEDLAVALAAAGRSAEAHTALTEAVELYDRMGAAWDVRRAAARGRGVGVRLGSRGPRRRPTRGWEALTPTERRIAGLVAEGRSNPDIATEMVLSRRTVQTHVSRILTKLEAHSRVEIAREVTVRADG
jgi:DNA-binding CsgD family transcriptional regulator